MLNMKMINLIKCKAAKKLKIKYSHVQIVWKVTNLAFSYEELGVVPELSFMVEGRLNNAQILQRCWSGAA